MQVGDRTTPYVSQARYVTTRPDITYKDRVDRIRSVRCDSNIGQDTSTDDERIDSNENQDNSSGQNRGNAFTPIATQTDNHDLARNLDIPQVDGAADRTADRTDKLEDNMRKLTDMQKTVQDQIRNLTIAIAPINNISDELVRIQTEIRSNNSQNRPTMAANPGRIDQPMQTIPVGNIPRPEQTMPVIAPVHRTDQPMSSQSNSTQSRQATQVENDIRSTGSVSSQQTNTSQNNTIDYPPPSLREGVSWLSSLREGVSWLSVCK